MVVTESDDERLKSAILRELSRDGQVYYIHNRVESIYGVADRLQKLLPQARILVGYGQMESDALDRVVHTFKTGQADILVATTIIENGVDIPNANTIIVERADHYGLADLYQLRGRVGRWNRRAYAYFLVPPERSLSEISRKRLTALLEIGSHGAGLRVAMRDLEIRGAGNILGTEQSGCASAIGFHLYCDLLSRSVKNLRAKTPVGLIDTKLDFPQDARIPDSYIDEPSLRMEIHQRFGKAEEEEEVDLIFEELKDRFGKPPLPLLWLYHIMRLRVFASRERISALKLRKLTLTIERQKGKKIESKMVIIQPATTPQELEDLVKKAISSA
jgi:transcription-repair coupling factor (superfamily II helicase)